jgi:hypothetical protein
MAREGETDRLNLCCTKIYGQQFRYDSGCNHLEFDIPLSDTPVLPDAPKVSHVPTFMEKGVWLAKLAGY